MIDFPLTIERRGHRQFLYFYGIFIKKNDPFPPKSTFSSIKTKDLNSLNSQNIPICHICETEHVKGFPGRERVKSITHQLTGGRFCSQSEKKKIKTVPHSTQHNHVLVIRMAWDWRGNCPIEFYVSKFSPDATKQ